MTPTRAISTAGKTPLWLLSVLMPCIPGASALALAATGQTFWAFFPLVFYFGILPIADILAGEDPFNPTPDEASALATSPYYRALLFAAILAFYASFLICAVVVAQTDLSPLAYGALALSVGVASGGGLTVGHELGHKPNKLDQWGAFFMNALCGYGHFKIEHNRGHHTQVATPEDSASARLGESVWRFALREIPGGVARGAAHERQRLEKRGLTFWTFENEILQSYAFSAALTATLFAALGWTVLPFILIHNVAAWLQLTFANYVEHYGLLRQKTADGRFEPCAPRHSWNSNHIVSNLSLFHLQRHSDHHAHPLIPYQSLRNFEDLPRLPSGYMGCFLLASLPPLWRRVMDPKVLAWAGGDLSKVNVAPHAAERYGVRAAKA